MAQSKNEFGAGKGSFRQAQAWLHTWCGLWFSWLLYAVFLTGTLAVFEEPITHWMTPEHHAHEQAQARSVGTAQEAESSLSRRLQWGLAYMKRQHPGADMWELWPADAQGGGDLRVYWFDANGQYAAARLDPELAMPWTLLMHPRCARPWVVIILWISITSFMRARWASGLSESPRLPCWWPWSAGDHPQTNLQGLLHLSFPQGAEKLAGHAQRRGGADAAFPVHDRLHRHCHLLLDLHACRHCSLLRQQCRSRQVFSGGAE